MRLLDDYMNAWNLKDLARLERTISFPHYRSRRQNERAGPAGLTGRDEDMGIDWQRLASQPMGSPAHHSFVCGQRYTSTRNSRAAARMEASLVPLSRCTS
jgi:hypothetical protein